MIEFSISKNGYDVVEVESYIVNMKASYENQLQEQKDRIFDQKRTIEQLSNGNEGELMASLLKSVERARQIEISSQNIYELETKRLQLFYAKMESVVEEITTNQDCREIKRRLTALISEFKEVLNENITIQKKAVSSMEFVDPVQRLLSKMSSTNVKLKEFVPAQDVSNVKRLNSNQVSSTAAAAVKKQVEAGNTARTVKTEKVATKKESVTTQQVVSQSQTSKSEVQSSQQTARSSQVDTKESKSVQKASDSDVVITKTGVVREKLKGVEVGQAIVSEKMSASIVKNADNQDSIVVDTTVETYRKEFKDDEQHVDSTKMITTYERETEKDGASVTYKPDTTIETNSQNYKSHLSLKETPDKILVDKTVSTKINDGPAEVETHSAQYDKKTGSTSSVSSSTIKPLISKTVVLQEPTTSVTKKTVKTEQETSRKLGSILEDDKVSGTNFESIMFKKSDQKNKNSVVGAKLTYPTPNESGFDLKEAVNPKDDLEEIMKAFDFYDEDSKDKKKK